MLYIIGTGLNDYRDLSLRSMEILQQADEIYQECYTCVQAADFHGIEKAIGREIKPANRNLVEETMDIVEAAKYKDIVFLVAGTPLFATTHMDIIIRAKSLEVKVSLIHNISILNVKGCYGLYSYNYGRTVSIPYFTESCTYVSCYDKIHLNWSAGMHTLCLLDIKTDENRFMTANEAVSQLLLCEEIRKTGMFTLDTLLFVVCRFATDDELVKFGRVGDIMKMDFGRPLHSLIIPAQLDEVERELVASLFPGVLE